MQNVDFYYSLGSRYSYLAFTQLSSLEDQTGCAINFHPLNSVSLMNRRGTNPFSGSPISGQYNWVYRELDARRWAALYGVPFKEPRGHVEFDAGVLAAAAITAKRMGVIVPFTSSMFAAMFRLGLPRIDLKECIRQIGGFGIKPADFRRELEATEAAQACTRAEESALRRGVFGVPTFIVDGELFWGNDRLVLLRAYLEGVHQANNALQDDAL